MEEYKRLKRTLVHKGSIIDYYQDEMLVPNGNVALWDHIEHKGAAAVVAVGEDGKLLMVRQYRNSIERETIEIPAGGKNPDEDFKTSAIRELEEETGYIAGHTQYLMTINTTVAFCNEVIEIYLCTDLTPSKQNLDEDEFLNVEKYSLDELLDMIKQGKIKDSKTVSAILFYAEFVK